MKIAVEGNIGSGKSTLMAAAKRMCRESFEFFFEPLETWHDLLHLYFQDPATWALPFTLEVLRSHDRVLGHDGATSHCVVERSPYACRYVFSEILKHDGYLSADDMELVDKYFRMFAWTPDVVVLVDVEPHVCLERIAARGRDGEAPSYDYLRCIRYYYDKMLHSTLQRVPVYRLIQGSTESKEAFQARFALLLENVIKEAGAPQSRATPRREGSSGPPRGSRGSGSR